MTDVLIYARHVPFAELRHEVPLGVPDPFLYVERDGDRHIVISSMEIPRLPELGGFELHPCEEFGSTSCRGRASRTRRSATRSPCAPCRRSASRGRSCPTASRCGSPTVLRAAGVELTPDRELFDGRRRVEDGGRARRDPARPARGRGRDGRGARPAAPGRAERRRAWSSTASRSPSERVKAAIRRRSSRTGSSRTTSSSRRAPQAAVGHDMGSGPIQAGEPIVIDLWPRDDETRLLRRHDPHVRRRRDRPTEVAEWHASARRRSTARLRRSAPGVTRPKRSSTGRATSSRRPASRPSARRSPGEPLADGFFHGLGHGVGLEVHEQPGIGLASKERALAGDVLAIEPGLYRAGLRRCPARGSRARDRERRREPDAVPVRPEP